MQTNKITRCPVNLREREKFLPFLFGHAFIFGESVAFHFARSFSPDYDGGSWQFFKLTNDTGYMAPDTEKEFRFISNLSFVNETMSADAFGIAITIYALSLVFEKIPSGSASDRIVRHIDCLKDYANQHPEGSKIFHAID